MKHGFMGFIKHALMYTAFVLVTVWVLRQWTVTKSFVATMLGTTA